MQKNIQAREDEHAMISSLPFLANFFPPTQARRWTSDFHSATGTSNSGEEPETSQHQNLWLLPARWVADSFLYSGWRLGSQLSGWEKVVCAIPCVHVCVCNCLPDFLLQRSKPWLTTVLSVVEVGSKSLCDRNSGIRKWQVLGGREGMQAIKDGKEDGNQEEHISS